MDKKQFSQYVDEGFNHIPVYKEILCDLDTPLTLFMKLANQPYSYLLESVQGGEQWARYSMIGLASHKRIEIHGNEVHEFSDYQLLNQFTSDDPLAYVDTLIERYKVPENIPNLPKFLGGLVGYFSYDVIRLIEPRLSAFTQEDLLNVPDALLLLSEEVVVLDNFTGKAYIIVMTEPNGLAYQNSVDKIEQYLQKFEIELQQALLSTDDSKTLTRPNFYTSETKFKSDVEKVKEYIKAGDAFQVVLSQRMSLPFEKDPLDLYRILRTINPSPYMYYLNLGDFCIVGASPEILVRFEDGQAQVRPIAGTRPRGKTHEEDLALEKELLADPKEVAEHVMLIDLGRNDIGRIANAGAVTVDEKMLIERYSHVMHIVSNVIGQVKPNHTAMDVFKAVFPAGTLSGAPKIRAMEIIAELEPIKRNIYGGAIGYISWTGNMDTAITIRTAVIKDDTLYVQAGAGLVYDSVADSEWQETLNKAGSILSAVAKLGD